MGMACPLGPWRSKKTSHVSLCIKAASEMQQGSSFITAKGGKENVLAVQ